MSAWCLGLGGARRLAVCNPPALFALGFDLSLVDHILTAQSRGTVLCTKCEQSSKECTKYCTNNLLEALWKSGVSMIFCNRYELATTMHPPSAAIVPPPLLPDQSSPCLLCLLRCCLISHHRVIVPLPLLPGQSPPCLMCLLYCCLIDHLRVYCASSTVA